MSKNQYIDIIYNSIAVIITVSNTDMLTQKNCKDNE